MDKMHTLDEAVLESTLVNDELPPPYKASDSTAPSYTLYAKFPRIMNAYAGWNATSIYISGSGSDRSDRLYCADYHMGYSSKGPLGSRPGMYLYNGPEKKGQVLAAAGDVSQWAARVYAFNTDTILMLPPINPRAATSPWVTEKMAACVSESRGVTFSFTVEAGTKEHRQRFEWRRRSDDKDDEGKGFVLFRILPSSEARKLVAADDYEEETEEQVEEVAVLTWVSLLRSITHYFSLELKGSAESGLLGDRCVLTIVLTALRLKSMQLQGRASKSTVSIASKKGKAAAA